MKAAVFERYGPPDVVSIKEMPTPEPGDKDLLIKVHTTTVNSADWRIRSLSVPPGFSILVRLFFGIFKPRNPILGLELAGEIAKTGKQVSKFAVGDPVIAFPSSRLGAHAEYIALSQDAIIVRKPENLSYPQAASLSFGGTTALDFLRHKGKLQPGEKVLVIGASGTVGLAAVQVAKQLGAEVTGVCSVANADLVKSLGTDHIIDYRTEDFLQSGATWDVVFDTIGSVPLSQAEPLLNSNGRFLMLVASFADSLRAPFASWKDGKKAIAGTAVERQEDVQWLADQAAAGKYQPVIDSVYPLEAIVAAHQRVDTGHKVGSVIVTMPTYDNEYSS